MRWAAQRMRCGGIYERSRATHGTSGCNQGLGDFLLVEKETRVEGAGPPRNDKNNSSAAAGHLQYLEGFFPEETVRKPEANRGRTGGWLPPVGGIT